MKPSNTTLHTFNQLNAKIKLKDIIRQIPNWNTWYRGVGYSTIGGKDCLKLGVKTMEAVNLLPKEIDGFRIKIEVIKL